MNPGLVRHMRQMANAAMKSPDYRAWEAGLCLLAAADRVAALEREVNPSWDSEPVGVPLADAPPAPATTPKCKHDFASGDACAKCGAERKRRARAPVDGPAVPEPEGGAA